MRGFGLDGKFFRGLTKAGDFLILGLITVIFCIPVITIGASLTAAFYAGMKLVKDEENYVFKDFWKSFKTNFVQGLLVELIMGVIGLLLFFDIRACAYWAFSSGSMAGTIFMYAIAGCALVWAGVLLYSFAVLSRYDDKAITIVKNSLILCVHHLPQTFIMMIATYGLILFSLKYFTAFIVTIPLIIYVDSFIFTRIFKSSNMSVGVNVLINLSKQATNTLGNITDIEIIEKHHNKKVDAPSGTAKMIANAINKELDDSMEFNYGRSGNDAKRKENYYHAIFQRYDSKRYSKTAGGVAGSGFKT